jgi:hypothetical protein
MPWCGWKLALPVGQPPRQPELLRSAQGLHAPGPAPLFAAPRGRSRHPQPARHFLRGHACLEQSCGTSSASLQVLQSLLLFHCRFKRSRQRNLDRNWRAVCQTLAQVLTEGAAERLRAGVLSIEFGSGHGGPGQLLKPAETPRRPNDSGRKRCARSEPACIAAY